MSLPPGWALLSPEDVAEPQRYSLAIGPFGSNLKVSDYTTQGVPLIFVRNIRSGDFGGRATHCVSLEKAAELRQHSVVPGDLLVTKMGDPPGDAEIYPGNQPGGIITSDCIKLTPNQVVTTSNFLNYAFRTPFLKRQIREQTNGVAQQKLSLERFRLLQIPVAPLNEQRRIVARIEELTARSKSAKEALQAIPPLLEKFRQSVLAAAFRGDLTAEWRRQNQGEWVSQRGLSKTGGDTIPAGWHRTTLGAICDLERGRFSIRPRNDPRYFGGSHPFVQIGDLPREGGPITSFSQTLNAEGRKISKAFPAGTILIAIVGATIGNSGILTFESCCPDSLVGVRPKNCLVGFVDYYLRFQKLVLRKISYASGGQPNINLKTLSPHPVLLPPLEEQQEIVNQVDSLFASADGIARLLADSGIGVKNIEPSILSKAFRGELVPQDPNDEPASTLLDRIRAERTQHTPARQKRK